LHAQTDPRSLVGIRRADAALRRAEAVPAETTLGDTVQLAVVRHDQVRVAGQHQPGGVDPAALQRVHLLDEHFGVDDDPRPDDGDAARIEDPGRDQMERVTLALDDDRVAGVVAALIADDEIGLLGQEVGDLALALVAPLHADESDARHQWAAEVTLINARF
jgi:hypothetical protein